MMEGLEKLKKLPNYCVEERNKALDQPKQNLTK